MNIVAHNLLAMNAQRQFGINTKNRAKSTEKLSSGYKINRAADDAAGLAISEKMRRQIRGLDQGAKNTQDGISFVQIGDGAMEEIVEMVHRMEELSVKAANGTMTDDEREYVNQEVNQLKTEINRIAETTTFNEIPIFDNHAVTFGVQGSPNDLQIFNATYDNAGNIATYGGFLFHGERITWDMIDPDMVTTDAAGKQVFNGGDYSYKSVNTNYEFEFRCEDGDVPPVITREISIEADANGIYLGGEYFDWSKVYDTEGNVLDVNHLHEGPWAVDYYGAKFIFTVSEPIDDISDFAKDIDSCKNASVYYNWEVYYSEGADETAVDVKANSSMLSPSNGDGVVSQDVVNTMLNAGNTGLAVTVAADENGIWLKDNKGQDLSASKVSWEDLGIKSWEEGMDIPGYAAGKEVTLYTYKDPGAGTGVTFQFELSDITSLDSVLDGLDGMVLTGTPGIVAYKPTVITTGGGNIQNATLKNYYARLTFQEEIAVGREFDDKNWDTDSTSVSYSEISGTSPAKLTVSFAGGMELSGEATDANAQMRGVMIDYLGWVAKEKTEDVLAGAASDTFGFDDYTGAKVGDITIPLTKVNTSMELNYSYDYSAVLKDLTNNVDVTMVGNSDKDIKSGSYVKDGDKYVDSVEYLQQKNNEINVKTYEAIENNTNMTDAEKEAATEAAREQDRQDARANVETMDKYRISVTYTEKDDTTPAVSNSVVADSVLPDIWAELTSATTINLEAQDYSRLNSLRGDENPNVASRPAYIAMMKETPVEPDIYIVHSANAGDKTGIPRFAMNSTALGIAFSDCKTVEGALQTLSDTRNALRYVSTKRSTYGALQNRMEHTYDNNRNISENLSAAESRIRDTDMAKEMVKYSNLNILEQLGHAMMAQANQSNQGVLSLLG